MSHCGRVQKPCFCSKRANRLRAPVGSLWTSRFSYPTPRFTSRSRCGSETSSGSCSTRMWAPSNRRGIPSYLTRGTRGMRVTRRHCLCPDPPSSRGTHPMNCRFGSSPNYTTRVRVFQTCWGGLKVYWLRSNHPHR